jgi:Ca2+/Na+ antiporter
MMFLAGILVIIFIKTGQILNKKEGVCLLIFYAFSLMIEFYINHVY